MYPLHQTPSLGLGEAEVGLQLANITELLLSIRGGNGGRHDNIISRLPINRGHHTLLVAGLKGVNDTEDLSRVAASRCGIHHAETDLLAGVNYKNGSDRKWNAFLSHVVQIALVDHIVKKGNLALGIGDDRELEVGGRNFVDILDPLPVGTEIVGAL